MAHRPAPPSDRAPPPWRAPGDADRRRAGCGGWRCSTRPSPTRPAISRAPLLDTRRGGEPQQRIGQQRELDVLEHGLAVQGAGMLEHDADALPRDAVRGPARDVHAVEHDLAGIGSLDAHDQLHDGGLARSVRPDQAENFPGRIWKLMSFTATSPPKRLLICSTSIKGAALVFIRVRLSAAHRPSIPSGKNRITARATAETTKVLSWPSGRRASLAPEQENRAQQRRRGSCAGRPTQRR